MIDWHSNGFLKAPAILAYVGVTVWIVGREFSFPGRRRKVWLWLGGWAFLTWGLLVLFNVWSATLPSQYIIPIYVFMSLPFVFLIVSRLKSQGR